MKLSEYIADNGDAILYSGSPDFRMLNELAAGPGDIWHSSFEQGFKNMFPELVYQTAIFFWYINDFEDIDQCVSWRVNPNQFAVRKHVWELLNGFDADYKTPQMSALHFAYNALRWRGAIPFYVKNLFRSTADETVAISALDRYMFFRKNFKFDHSLFMLWREGLWKVNEWRAFFEARKFRQVAPGRAVPPRNLNPIQGTPTVSYIIPTMFRQDYTLQLLKDLATQSMPPYEVVIVDATPEGQREDSVYDNSYPFKVTVLWQKSKGSCRARNEAIRECSGDFIVFGDDDIRIPSDFIENHVRLLQTYNADACNGLDIRADHHEQDLSNLREKLDQLRDKRWIVGATQIFSNANSCVRSKYVTQLQGNDINYDGGYGEDADFGISLIKAGAVVLHNPFSANLHLKPPAGGYRFWGAQAKILGKKRKSQPWELDVPVKSVRPVPSPTIMYMVLKHFSAQQLIEYRIKYFFLFLSRGPKWLLPYRILRVPYKQMQFNKSLFYAKRLMAIGKRV